MITLHESNITSFPLDNGIGVLSDAIKAYAEEELNGLFEFEMEYDSEGFLVEELKEERIIKAKAQDKLGYQLFRIYSITKNHENDNLIINAQHITYDNADNFVEELIANNMTKKQVMELIGSSAVEPHPFNITSPNNTTRSSTKLYRTNPLQMIAGMQGSILQIWGGQIERDNFNLIMHDRRGHDDGVKVTYEKNITGLTAEFDIGGLITRVYPFIYIEATDDSPERLITVSGKYIDSDYINDYDVIRTEPIDYSSDDRIDTQDKTDAQIRTQLTNIANRYFNETSNDKPKATFDVQFAHLWETEEYKDVKVLELVGMGDTVTIEHSKLKVEATATVNYIRYDCIAEVNEEVKLGNVKSRFSDSINKIDAIEKKIEEVETNANQAIVSANGKNTTFYGPDEPSSAQIGDLWFKYIDGQYHRTYRFDGIEWQLIVDMESQEAKAEAQQAKNIANESVEKANLATANANEAIGQAQTAFSKAQESLEGLDTLVSITDAQGRELTTIKGGIEGLQAKVTDAEDNIATLQTTATGFASRFENAEGDINTLTSTAQGLQNRITNAEGDIATVTQLANTHQTKITNIEGDVSTLTQTSTSIVAQIGDLYNSKNLINNVVKGGISPNNGVELDNDNFMRTDYIEVEKYTDYIMSIDGAVAGNHLIEVLFYDDYKTYLMRYHSSDDHFNTGNAKYVRVSAGAKLSDNLKIQLEKGTTITPFKSNATQAQLSMLSDDINLRVQKGDIINQINVSTESILISGKKLILDGDTTVTGLFRVDDANITSLDAGKMTTGILDAALVNVINLNASNIATGTLIGINIQGARFYSASENDYMEIVGGNIELSLNNGRKLDISPTGFYGYNQGGSIRFQADASLVTSAAFGTSNVNVYLASSAAGEARVVDYNTLPAGGNINDYSYNPIRSLIYRFPDIPNGYFTLYNGGEFRFTGESITSPVYQAVRAAGYYGNYLDARGTVDHLYVRPRTSAGELRVTRSGTTDDYLDVRARNLAGVRVGLGTHFSNSTNFYVTTSAGGEVRFVSRADDAAYRPIRISDLITHSGQISTSDSSITVRANGSNRYIFLQMENSLRVTGPGQASTFKSVYAADFIPSSSEQWKTNIKKYEDSALELFRQSIIYQYNKHDSAETEYGLITERETPIEIKRGDGISSYSLQGLTVRAVQELDTKVDLTREELILKVAKLESRIIKLESAA